jgi:hypothetical protein
MADDQSAPRIELEAARLADEWEDIFAAELKSAAERIAIGSAVITADHYCQAAPAAVARVLQAVQSQTVESANVHRRIA